jgi:hypothetical protein
MSFSVVSSREYGGFYLPAADVAARPAFLHLKLIRRLSIANRLCRRHDIPPGVSAQRHMLCTRHT